MHEIHLSEQLYRQAQERASEAGFGNVDDFVAQIVAHEVQANAANFDEFFTKDVLAELDSIFDGGRVRETTLTSAEVDEHFRRKSAAWRASRGA